jgi:hypothetical protein
LILRGAAFPSQSLQQTPITAITRSFAIVRTGELFPPGIQVSHFTMLLSVRARMRGVPVFLKPPVKGLLPWKF